MSVELVELAGPADARHTHYRALPLLRLAAADDVDVETAFGDCGLILRLSAAAHLTHPALSVADFAVQWGHLREAVIRFEAYNDGTLEGGDDWTDDEIVGEVLYPLTWLLRGAEGCRACFAVGHHAGMIRPQIRNDMCCQLCVIKFCQPCLADGTVLRHADLVVGGRGYCTRHADVGDGWAKA